MKLTIHFEEIKLVWRNKVLEKLCTINASFNMIMINLQKVVLQINCVFENVLQWLSDLSFRNWWKTIFGSTNEFGVKRQNMSISRIRHVNFIYEICPINFILTNLYWIAFHEIEIESCYMNDKNLRLFSISSKSNISLYKKVLKLDIHRKVMIL